MKTIVKIKFGSHLYGTATQSSDLDIKSVHIPPARDILLQNVQPVISNSSNKIANAKNTPEDIDYESYSLRKFLEMLAEGQMVALDMLFAPKESMLTEPDGLWQDIKALSRKLFNKKSISFVRYCRQQANKYGIKGSRFSSAKQALELLNKAEKEHSSSSKLIVIIDELEDLVRNNQFLELSETYDSKNELIRYFQICGKKSILNSSIKSAQNIARRLVNEYGTRALTAEKNEGVDWKALSHAVRVGNQAIEFLSSHHITFPRPEAQYLLAIKQGQLTFKQVSEDIENLLSKIERASAASTLPEGYDSLLIDDFIEKLYKKIIIMEFEND